MSNSRYNRYVAGKVLIEAGTITRLYHLLEHYDKQELATKLSVSETFIEEQFNDPRDLEMYTVMAIAELFDVDDVKVFQIIVDTLYEANPGIETMTLPQLVKHFRGKRKR